MKLIVVCWMGLILLLGCFTVSFAFSEKETGNLSIKNSNWRLGCQLWSFNRFSFMEAIDKTASLGLKFAEAFPNQRLSADLPEDIKFVHTMSQEHRQLVRDKLAATEVKVVSYGVVGLPNDEQEARKVFEFAKDMGIETIASEPPKSALDLIEKLADEYGINVAIHNHPKPSLYWDYKTVVQAVSGRSSRLGACADTGHWARSGLDPLESVKALEGRLVSFHLKDLNEFGERAAHDVIWGTGVVNVKGVLEEVRRQGANPLFMIEYEHNWDNNLPDINACIEYFNKVLSEITKSE